MAGDPSRDPPPCPPKPWLKHQAFMAELAQNKEWLEKIEKVEGGEKKKKRGGRSVEGREG